MAYFASLTDSFLWPHNKGACSIKSTSKFLFQRHQVPWNKALWQWIWVSPCPKKIQIFLCKAMRDHLPTKTYLSFVRSYMDIRCPRCHSPETTIHILQDCPWAKEVWHQSLGILPLSFFQLPLQDWLRYNATVVRTSLPHHPPWQVYFPFTCWKLWLARNERIFTNKSQSQHSLIYSSVQAANEFHFLASTTKRPLDPIPQIISWQAPLPLS